MNVFIVDAFTRAPGSGNRAGVVLDGAGLEEAAMRAAATAVAASETAFVGALGPEVHLRYFSPAAEIPFCGHATVATFHLLVERGLVATPSRPTLVCPAGRFAVELDERGRTWIETPLAPFEASPIAPAQLFALLGGEARMADPELPILRAGWKIYVPLARQHDLHALAPRFQALAAAGSEHGVLGFYVFTREVSEPGSAVHARFFAPGAGVREDPATGSASGPIGAYLVGQGVVSAPVRLRAEQGDAMGKPGRVDIEVQGRGRTVERARISGEAVTVLEGRLVQA
jgi:PhzF family phenazine biosynthesis protein